MSSSAQDPFYIVKEEIQDSINKLLSSSHQWENDVSGTGEHVHLTKVILASCDSLTEQVDELDKATSVAAKNPAHYGIDAAELNKRRKWTKDARDQVGTVKKKVSGGKGLNYQDSRLELTRLPVEHSHKIDMPNQYGQRNEDFISSESDSQSLLMKNQDEELDLLSQSVEKVGQYGRLIHDELIGQEKMISDLDNEMDSTSNRLDFLQKKVEIVLKKAGAKGQIMMILFLVILFIILFVLVFFT